MRCIRCSKPLPDHRVLYYLNIPFGSHCKKVLFQRILLRSQGTWTKSRTDIRLGIHFWASQESDKVCPDSNAHCISCPEFHKKLCALERHVK